MSLIRSRGQEVLTIEDDRDPDGHRRGTAEAGLTFVLAILIFGPRRSAASARDSHLPINGTSEGFEPISFDDQPLAAMPKTG
jgi:hypothetical protein